MRLDSYPQLQPQMQAHFLEDLLRWLVAEIHSFLHQLTFMGLNHRTRCGDPTGRERCPDAGAGRPAATSTE